MDRWTLLLLGSNVIYWGVFVCLLRLRRWSWSGLLVGALHMLIATFLVLGPWRALFGQPDFHYEVGYVEGTGRGAFVPSLVLLAWALWSAWLPVIKERGRWILLGAVGDALMTVNVVATVLTSDLTAGRIQAGDYFTIAGAELVSALLVVFATPLVASSVWAFRRLGERPPGPPRIYVRVGSAYFSQRFIAIGA